MLPTGIHALPHLTGLTVALHVPSLQHVWPLNAHCTHCSSSPLCLGSHSLCNGGGGLFHPCHFCTSPMHALGPLAHITLLKKLSSCPHILLPSPLDRVLRPTPLDIVDLQGWLANCLMNVHSFLCGQGSYFLPETIICTFNLSSSTPVESWVFSRSFIRKC